MKDYLDKIAKNGNGSSINGFDDKEMVEKKQKEIDNANLRKMIQDAVDTALITSGKSSATEKPEYLTEVQRLHANEAKIKIVEDVVAELSDDSLKLAKRVATIGRTIIEVNKIVSEIQSDVRQMKSESAIIKTEEEKFENKKDKKWESRRDTILKVAAIIISIFAIIVSAIGLLSGG